MNRLILKLAIVCLLVVSLASCSEDEKVGPLAYDLVFVTQSAVETEKFTLHGFSLSDGSSSPIADLDGSPYGLVVSPGGLYVAIYELPTDNGVTNVAIRRANGQLVQELEAAGASGSGAGPFFSWSMDGTKLAYNTIASQSEDGGSAISIAVFDVVADEDVTPDFLVEERILGPTWSTISDTIAAAAGPEFSDIVLISLDEERLAQVRSDPVGPKVKPTWSPDGSLLAFFVETDEPDGVTRRAVIAITPDGTAVREITVRGFASPFLWSPDSAEIVLDCPSENGPSMEICVTNVMSGVKDVIATLAQEVVYPGFSPDGTAVAFLEWREAAARFVLKVTDLESSETIEVATDVPWHGYSWVPTGSLVAEESG